MLSTKLIMTIILVFKCIEENTNNKKTTLMQETEDKGSNNLSMINPFMQDFDYNTIKLSDLCQLKMPYINCNRRMLANSDKDLIDILLLDKNLQVVFLKGMATIKSKIEIVRHSIAKMLGIEKEYKFQLSEKKKYTSENILGVELNSTSKIRLNNEFIKINTLLNDGNTHTINRTLIQSPLGAIDGYIFEDLKCNNLFLYRLKPSIILFNDFGNVSLGLKKIRRFLVKIVDIYEELRDNFEFINLIILKLTNSNVSRDVSTSCILMNNILLKWYV